MFYDLLLPYAHFCQVFEELIHDWGGEESPPGRSLPEREREKKTVIIAAWNVGVILQQSARILHQCNGLKNHTTGCSAVKSPRRVYLMNKTGDL
jgi:hypothetical protein